MEKTALTKIWEGCLARLKQALDDNTYHAWILPLSLKSKQSQQAKKLILEAPDPFFKDWVINHYLALIQDTLKRNTIGPQDILSGVQIIARDEPTSQEIRSRSPKSRPAEQKKKDDFILNPRFTFDSFVVGPSNRFAHAASLAVAESPARAYNPLFIYGGVGLGKTHLMQSICQFARNKNSNLNICFIPSERFTNELINAIQYRSTSSFRQKYRNMDILVVDDIHFIAGKESTQEEFFHTFNALYDSHKQIIISSDRSPREIHKLEERLVSRFSWGLITDIQPPDFETRVAILKKKIEKEPIKISDEIIFFIADIIKTNIRELEGALIRVVARSMLEEQPITLNLTKEVLRDCIQQAQKPINIKKIQEYVANEFAVTPNELQTKRRSKNIVLPRQVAMYLSRRLTEASLPEIAKFFGGKDHTTVLYAYNKIKGDIEKREDLKNKIYKIIKDLKQ